MGFFLLNNCKNMEYVIIYNWVMEMFGNKKGNTTIESVIIVPVIMIFMVSFILVLITTYRFGVTVIDGLYVYIENHQEVTIEDEIRGIGFRKMVSLKYYQTVVDSKVLQDYVEYMIYQSKKYGHKLENKDE